MEKRADEEDEGGHKSLGVLGVLDRLRLLMSA